MSMHCLASLLLSAVLLLCPVAAAAEGQVHLYFFWGDGCPHCAAEREALRELEALYPQLYVHDFEVYSHPVNARLLQRVGEALRQDIGGVPFTVIADRTFVGFAPSVTLPQITGRIEECLGSTCHDSLVTLLQQSPSDSEPTPQPPAVPSSAAAIVTGTGATDILTGDISQPSSSFRFSIPLLGEIDARFISLPVLAVVMGMLDGFNPCALWTLLFLLSLLIGMTSRIRMWLLGSAFVVTSALVYFFFMTAWLQLILFLGFIFWVRLAIGGLALVGGAYSVSKGWGKGSGCIAEEGVQRKRIFDRIREAVSQRSLIPALTGIVVLAFAVNLIELVCSAGLPAVFTQILALNDLPLWQSYALIILYLLFFMIDDLFVFFVTMATLEMTGVTMKYARISRLVGGALMIGIGILLIFRPGWLMFG